MKWVKRVGLGLGVLVVALLAIGMFLPSVVDVTPEKTISASPEACTRLLSTTRTWISWSPWNNEMMPQMTSTYEGPETGVGSRWVWTDPETGDGYLEITAVDPGKSVDYELRFADYEPMKSHITLTPDGDKTRVVWHATWDAGSAPWMRWMILLMEDNMIADYLLAIEGLEKAGAKG